MPKDQIIYKIDIKRLKQRVKIDRNRRSSRLSDDADNTHQLYVFSNQLKGRRLNFKKSKNRKDISMKEYIDDYFMRQLGYSVLRKAPVIPTVVEAIPLEDI